MSTLASIVTRFSLLVALFLVGLQFASAQQDKPYNNKQNMKVETRSASYPGGEEELYHYISDHTEYSAEAKRLYVEGKVMMSFDVLPDGSVANAIVLSEPGYGIGDAVKKLVLRLEFLPAKQMGMPITQNMVMTFPVVAH